MTELQERWLEALESGDYSETEGFLQNGTGYCCLGVACTVMKLKKEKEDGLVDEIFNFKSGREESAASMPGASWKKLGLRNSVGEFKKPVVRGGTTYYDLTDMNDSGWSFKKIASYIRKHPNNVFVEE